MFFHCKDTWTQKWKLVKYELQMNGNEEDRKNCAYINRRL